MKKIVLAVLAVGVVATAVGCAGHGSSGSGAGAQATGTMTPVPPDVKAKEFVTFNFTDVAVSSGGSPVLRLTFDAKNGSSDPLLCDESSFSAELANGTVLPPDAGAQNVCDPDSIDPNGTSKVVMFFDLPSGYNGPVMLLMRASDDTLVGQGTTNVNS